jgi:uncharacterized iron-regulated membrane protein
MTVRNRRFWFLLHGWLSLPVWGLLLLVCLTGTIATISHEITWLANPAARALNPDGLAEKSPDVWVDIAEQAMPEGEVANVMRLEPYLVAIVTMNRADAAPAMVYINPYTGAVQDIHSGQTFISFMRALHGWLLFPWQAGYSVGYYLVSALSLVMLGSLLTGLIAYKRFWRAFTRPRLRTGQLRIALGDWHRLAGVWSLWFLLILGLTGLWYLIQAALWHQGVEFESDPAPLSWQQVLFSDGEPPQKISLRQAIQTALNETPGLQISWVSPPEYAQDLVSVLGQQERIFYDDYSDGVFINPWSGEIVGRRQPQNMGALEKLSHLADPLHYGTIGGLTTKIIWFLSGLVLTSLLISGFMIWRQRLFGSGKGNPL